MIKTQDIQEFNDYEFQLVLEALIDDKGRLQEGLFR